MNATSEVVKAHPVSQIVVNFSLVNGVMAVVLINHAWFCKLEDTNAIL